MNINKLNEALQASWSRDTAYRTDQNDWSLEKRETGQCTITAMLVYDYFGGKIIRGKSKKYNIIHYWNEIEGKKVDLTYGQFIGSKDDIEFTNISIMSKERLMNISNVRSRYLKLKKRVESYLENGDKNLIIF